MTHARREYPKAGGGAWPTLLRTPLVDYGRLRKDTARGGLASTLWPRNFGKEEPQVEDKKNENDLSPRPAVSLGSRPLSTSGVRSRVGHAPIPVFGYRWCAWVSWRVDQAYFETRRNATKRDVYRVLREEQI